MDIEKISVEDFKQAINKNNVISKTLIGTKNVTIRINKTIALNEMILFVQEVVESCIDGENGEYIPEAYDFAIRSAVLTYYANFTMPENMDERYWLLYNSHAFQQVLENINTDQFNAIIKAIDSKIKYMLDTMSSSAVAKINEIVGRFDEITTMSKNMFNGVSSDDMSKFVKGVARLKDIKEEDIAKAIINSKNGENNG